MKRVQMTSGQKQEGREKLMEKWKKKILCCKSSAQQVRAGKKVIQKRRQDYRNVVADQDEYITEVLRQEKEMREYKA